MAVSSPTAVFVVDSKNISHGFSQRLRAQGLDAHIYVANEEGDVTLDSVSKGKSWDSFHRDKELDAIFQYGTQHGGIRAIIIPVSMYLNEDEMISVVAKIRQRDRTVPLVICGCERSSLQEGFIAANKLSIYEDTWLLDGREESEKAFVGFLKRIGAERQL